MWVSQCFAQPLTLNPNCMFLQEGAGSLPSQVSRAGGLNKSTGAVELYGSTCEFYGCLQAPCLGLQCVKHYVDKPTL